MKNASFLHLGLLLASVAALVASIVLYAYVHHDTLTLADHAIVARNAAADEGQRARQSKEILALASSTAASRARLSGMFVPADDAVAFIQAMEAVGPASGAKVSISSINESAADQSKKGTIGTLSARVTLTGTWKEVMNAVELFEVLPYKTSIDHLTLDTSIGSGDRAQPAARAWQATFDITASTII